MADLKLFVVKDTCNMNKREQMNIVVVGHVDHGKSTVIGRLLADTGSLPDGKLDQVKAMCERNARPFEYAFLLDALKDEQAQGITIDTARCFFTTKKREYIIIDAPGHVEFLKNMVSGAARAEAALLVIDAHEGIKENSKRHGYLISMLGIRQIIIVVNKMDLINYDQNKFNEIVNEYSLFLDKLGVQPVAFVPISARNGENLTKPSVSTSWYKGNCVLDLIDGLKKQENVTEKPFRLPVQDIYKFTEHSDDRRIFAGTIETGCVSVGDEVVFWPSAKRSTIATIEGFNTSKQMSVGAASATGVTLTDELYIKRGEVMCRTNQTQVTVATQFRANIFWMGKSPLIKDKKYKLKITTARATVRLLEVVSCIDATTLSSVQGKQQIDRHDVAECIFETTKPITFDPIGEIEATGRFVIVDNYDIAGGGIIIGSEKNETTWLAAHVNKRETAWERGGVTLAQRLNRNGHGSRFVFIGGENSKVVASALEYSLFSKGFSSYYLGIDNLRAGMDSDLTDEDYYSEGRLNHIGEIGRILTDAGFIFITASNEVDNYDFDILRKLNEPNPVLIVSLSNKFQNPDIFISQGESTLTAVQKIVQMLQNEGVIPEYSI